MVNELLPLVAIAGVVFGVFLSVAKGYNSKDPSEKFAVGKVLQSLIIGSMNVLSVSMLIIASLTEQVNELGFVAFTFLFIMQGFGTDQGLSYLNRDKR